MNKTPKIENQTPHQSRIEDFMRKAKQDVPDKPTIPSNEVAILRAKLIHEESGETIRALGVSPIYVFQVRFAEGTQPLTFQIDLSKIKQSELIFEKTGPTNLIEVADGCADISVVTIGTLSACGIKDGPVLEAVDQNNLEKFGEGHYWREDGKLCKSPNHKKVDLEAVLKEQSA